MNLDTSAGSLSELFRREREIRKAKAVIPRQPIVAGKLRLFPLIAATYFMVAGGPFGLEDIVAKAGYRDTILILLFTPLLWSLPTALMVSELASTLPEEGGFYVWVRRAMGPFWGYQEAWLSLAGSIFEMALYPTLFVFYLAHLFPVLVDGHGPLWLGLGMIVVCTLWNIIGARAVGGGSLLLGVVLLAPFAILAGFALLHRSPTGISHPALTHTDILGGVLIAMWNYMGWDNTSTIAGEVDRPQRTYPLAMFGAVLLVVVSYVVTIGAVAFTGLDPNSWSTGGWVDVGRTLGGEGLAVAITLAGVVGAIGTFNALMLSLTRLPVAMSKDGYLPKIFAQCHPRTGAPWVAIVVCAVGWTASLTLGFERLVSLDVALTGLSVLLEFCALIVLRVREPELPRPYRVPGGIVGAVLISLGPIALMIAALFRNRTELIGVSNAFTIGLAFILAGPVLYLASNFFRARHGRQ